MGGYIGARAGIGLVNTTLGSVQDLTATDASPEVTLINNTHEDTDGGREGKVIFKGQQSGGEESTLAEIEANHHGSLDDEKGSLVFRTNDGSDGASPTEAMRITSGQRLGLGDIDPDNVFNIKESELSGRPASNGNTSMTLEHATDTGIQFFSAAQTQLRFGDAASTGAGSIIYTHSDNAMKFSTDGSEAIRLDNSGNLLGGGMTSAAVTGQGFRLGSNGFLYVAAGNDNNTAIFNRMNSDGEVIRIQRDGSTFGKIVIDADRTVFCSDNGASGGGIKPTSTSIVPTNRTGSALDNVLDVGASSARFDDVRATNGTIQTSDENEKQDIASLTSAEITAATAISKLFKTYKWKDKVAAKGDDARTHTGVVAQQVETAMSDAGLDASKYAFWCSDTWWEKDVEVAAVEADEEKGIEAQDAYTRTDTYDTKDEAPEGATERTRLGVRYPELLAFIGAATEQRLTSIEARLDALEAQ